IIALFRTHNPLVPGSSPGGPTICFPSLAAVVFPNCLVVRSVVPARHDQGDIILCSTIEIADRGDDRLKQGVNRKEAACCVLDRRRLVYKGYEEDRSCVTGARGAEKKNWPCVRHVPGNRYHFSDAPG